MITNEFLKTILVLTNTKAAAVNLSTDSPLTVLLHKGRRFDAVTAVEEDDDYTAFHDLASGLTFVCPSGSVFLLNGRLSR